MRAGQKITILFLFPTIFFLSMHQARGQKQLVLLNGESVKLRLNPGDDFIYKLKNSKAIKKSYVNDLSETTVYTHRDTVPIHTIERIYFRHSTFMNRIGGGLVTGGILLFLIDQLNVVVVQGDKPSLDNGVSITSLTLVGAGLPMILIRKKSQRLNYEHRLIMVEKGSAFYK